jgi:hypothetical protein
MEVTTRLYHTLFGSRAYLRSICEGIAFFATALLTPR